MSQPQTFASADNLTLPMNTYLDWRALAEAAERKGLYSEAAAYWRNAAATTLSRNRAYYANQKRAENLGKLGAAHA